MRKPPTFYVIITYPSCKVRKSAWSLAQATKIAESAPLDSDEMRPEKALILRHGIVPEFCYQWDSDDESSAVWRRNVCI